MSRDDFSEDVKRVLADRVGHLCSNPECRASTRSPQIDPKKAVSVGVAAHITAASPGGPRYNSQLSPKERSDIQNGIWLCQNCAKLIDNDPVRYTVSLIQRWKREGEHAAHTAVGKTRETTPDQLPLSSEEVEILHLAAYTGEVFELSADQLGRWVRVGGHDFVDQDDPAVAVVYCEALESLCGRGLAKYDEGNLYMLTAIGFTVARRILANDEQAESGHGQTGGLRAN